MWLNTASIFHSSDWNKKNSKWRWMNERTWLKKEYLLLSMQNNFSICTHQYFHCHSTFMPSIFSSQFSLFNMLLLPDWSSHGRKRSFPTLSTLRDRANGECKVQRHTAISTHYISSKRANSKIPPASFLGGLAFLQPAQI